eukprot:4652963-Pyramimonas_sp.AAC.1
MPRPWRAWPRARAAQPERWCAGAGADAGPARALLKLLPRAPPSMAPRTHWGTWARATTGSATWPSM